VRRRESAPALRLPVPERDVKNVAVPAFVMAAEMIFATDWDAVGDHSPAAIAVLAAYIAFGSLVLLWRRSAPRGVFVIVWSTVAISGGLFFGTDVYHHVYMPFLPPLVALYGMAARRPWAEAIGALIASALPVGLIVAANVADRGYGAVSVQAASYAVFVWLLFGASWYAGRRANAHRAAVTDLERARQEAIVIERNRLARELHDIVSHAVSIMVLQAAGARAVFDDRPDQVTTALDNIEASGREAMSELRRLLEVLRNVPITEANAEYRTLAELDDLLTSLRATGVHIDLTVEGTPKRVDPSVDHSAYRVVQEALTNVLKYGGSDERTTVHIDWTEGLVVEVTNHGSAAEVLPTTIEPSGGYGLLGLHERVSMVGGDFEAGAGHDGRFRVRARLPVDGHAVSVE
jgi:signal transduction histidine kinase